MATIVATASGGNWTSGATWVGGVVPTAADDVQLVNTSGNVTINAAAVCRSLDCTGYTGTLTHGASVGLTVGDGTAGAGNIALKLSASMTYVCPSAPSQFFFISTSPTQQTVDTAGKTTGHLTFNGANGSWLLQSSVTTLGSVVLTRGTLNTNSQSITGAGFQCSNTNVRTLTLGSSAIHLTGTSIAWDVNFIDNLTVSPNTATLTMSGTSAIFQTGSVNYNGLSLVMSGMGAAVIGAGSATFANITRTGGSVLQLNGNAHLTTVTGTLTLTGNSVTSRLLLRPGTPGISVAINAADVVASNCDFQDIIAGGSANWDLSAIPGLSGDCGGNSGITFTPSQTQTWAGGTGGAWSTNAWTTRVPLPQDDAIITGNIPPGNSTLTMDMPRSGRNVDFSGVTGNSLVLNPNTATTIFGSLNFTGVSVMGASVAVWTFAGRGSHTINMAGFTMAKQIIIQAPGGSYTLQSNLTTTAPLNVSAGTLITNNHTITCDTFNVIGATASANLGSSTIFLTSTATANVFIRSSGTLTAGAATVVIANPSANTRTIQFFGTPGTATQMNLVYNVAGSTGSLAIIGTSLFGDFTFSDASDARTLILPASSIFISGTFNVRGTPGKPMSIVSATPGSSTSLVKTSGVVDCDYLNLQDSTASGGASWYAGANSVSVSNNSGWFFQPYSPSRFLEFI